VSQRKRNRKAYTITVMLGVMLLFGCGNSDIDIEIPEMGEVVEDIPGTAVPLETQRESRPAEGLSLVCLDALSNIRDIMTQYDSLREVPPQHNLTDMSLAAQETCSDSEWSEFYAKEYAPWQYGR